MHRVPRGVLLAGCGGGLHRVQRHSAACADGLHAHRGQLQHVDVDVRGGLLWNAQRGRHILRRQLGVGRGPVLRLHGVYGWQVERCGHDRRLLAV